MKTLLHTASISTLVTLKNRTLTFQGNGNRVIVPFRRISSPRLGLNVAIVEGDSVVSAIVRSALEEIGDTLPGEPWMDFEGKVHPVSGTTRQDLSSSEWDALVQYSSRVSGSRSATRVLGTKQFEGEKSLFSKLVRLAHENLDLRPHLLPLLRTSSGRQSLLWIPPRTQGTIVVPYTGPRPERVWTLLREQDEANPPPLPYSPVHGVNASVEDIGHDWKVQNGTFRYSSQSTDGGRWVLLEF